MQSRNKPLADLSNLVANAVGAAKGVGDELKAVTRSQAEKFIADMDLVTREEFDVLKMRLDAAHAEIETLKAAQKPKPKPKPKAAPRKTAKS
ncbi:MAG: accessory factor UbiK family protein [Pseudomonadota bacterium]